MGWKNLKERFRIEHTVHVQAEGICIGSAYVSVLIVVGLDGNIARVSDLIRPANTSDELARYLRDLKADPAAARRAIEAPDHFERSIPVYSYRGGSIVEHQCETLGWPNVTHDGEIMYGNTHCADRARVVDWAKCNARASVESARSRVQEITAQLANLQERLARKERDLAQLEADYPSRPAPVDAVPVEP